MPYGIINNISKKIFSNKLILYYTCDFPFMNVLGMSRITRVEGFRLYLLVFVPEYRCVVRWLLVSNAYLY